MLLLYLTILYSDQKWIKCKSVHLSGFLNGIFQQYIMISMNVILGGIPIEIKTKIRYLIICCYHRTLVVRVFSASWHFFKTNVTQSVAELIQNSQKT